jgi:hypothetical protein
MTSPLAVVGLTADGIDVQTFGDGIFLEIVVGLAESPVVRGEDTTIPAAAGSLEGNRINDYLPIELRGRVRAADGVTDLDAMRASHYANLMTVRTLFAPNRPRMPLVASLPGGSTLTIQAQPLNTISAEVAAGEETELSISLRGDGDWVVS